MLSPVLYFADSDIEIIRVRDFKRDTSQLLRVRPRVGTKINDFLNFCARYESDIINVLEEHHRAEVTTRGEVSFKLYFLAHIEVILFPNADMTGTAEAPQNPIIQDVWLQRSPIEIATTDVDYLELFNRAMHDIAKKIDMFQKERSGWVFNRLLELDINRSRHKEWKSIGRGGRNNYVPPLPPGVSTRCVLRLVGSPRFPLSSLGPNCFVQAIKVAALFKVCRQLAPKQDLARVAQWVKGCAAGEATKQLELSFHDKRLIDVNGVDKNLCYLFENENPNFFVVVVAPTPGANSYTTVRSYKHANLAANRENGLPTTVIHLLLYDEHYYPIIRFSGLISSAEYDRHLWICDFCHNVYRKKAIYDAHTSVCGGFATQKISLPKEGQILEFRNSIACQQHPIVIYADIESCLVPTTCDTESPSKKHLPPKKRRQTTTLNIHEACMVGFYISVLPEFEATNRLPAQLFKKRYHMFYGSDCMDKFIKELFDIVEKLSKFLSPIKKCYSGNIADGNEYVKNATLCHICNRSITEEDRLHVDSQPVLDHCHWTGSFRGVAHGTCNAKLRQQKRLFPVVIHNFKGYDCHHLCKAANMNQREDVHITCIPNTSEKYMSISLKFKVDSFTVEEEVFLYDKQTETVFDEIRTKTIDLFAEIRFIDSLQFLSASLSQLASLLLAGSGPTAFRHTKEEFLVNCGLVNWSALCLRKGVFPYTYLDSLEKLKDTVLPPREVFRNDLDGTFTLCSVDDYAFAQRVWTETKCMNFGQYTAFYLKVDCLLLADIFQNFRKDCYEANNLEVAFFYSLPGYAWASMLRRSAVQLELLDNNEMYNFFEQGIRGGITVVTSHYASRTDALPEGRTREILVLDANGLYSWAMQQPLPVGEFEFIESRDQIAQLFPMNQPNAWPSDTGEHGYVLMVDLDCPQDMHDVAASYPPAPAHEALIPERDYSLTMLKQWKRANPGKTKIPHDKKLLATLNEKKQYVCHYRLLKFYLQEDGGGLILTHIHHVVRFKQCSFMRGFIEHNLEERMKYKHSNPVRADLHKTINNSTFGKTQEQKRKHNNFTLSTDEEKTVKLVSQANYNGSVIFSENLVGLFMQKKRITLDQPLYVGFSVLDLSKLLMFTFFYKGLKPQFPESDSSVKVMYTDTDSLLLTIECGTEIDIMKRLANLKSSWIDGSNLAPSHPLYTTENEGALGFFKEEMGGNEINEVVALRPKMYAIKTSSLQEKKKAKGIKKQVVEHTLRFSLYKETYEQANEEIAAPVHYVTQRLIRSTKHELQTVDQVKKGLVLLDNKRYWLNNNDSVPYGHYLAKEDLAASYEERVDWFKRECNKDITTYQPRKQTAPFKRRFEFDQ